MAEEIRPVPLALVVCDGIHVDPGTGKKTLLGLFSILFGRTFPLIAPPLCVYAALTEWNGKGQVTLRIVDVNENHEPVFQTTGEIDCPDPLVVIDLDFRIGGVVFPEPGEYRIQLYASDTPVMERRLLVVDPSSLTPEPPREAPDHD